MNKIKLDRLQVLRKTKFLSDQEQEELEELEDEFRLEEDEAQEFKPKKQRKTVIQYLIERMKSKPATREEIEQLKLEKEKAILKRDIAVAKSGTPSKLANAMKLLSTINNQETKPKKKSYDMNLDIDHDHDKFKALLGNNDKDRFKNL